MDTFLLNLPLWAVMVVVIGLLTGAAVGLQALIRRRLPEVMARRHNDVAGFLAAVIGVIYAVTVGFIIAEQWSDFTDAKDRAAREAFTLASVAEGSIVFGPAEQDRFQYAVLAYQQAVIADWDRQGESGGAADLRQSDLMAPLYELLAQARPGTEGQRAFVQDATRRLAQAAQDRDDRLHRASRAHLEWPLWMLVVFVSAVVLVFCALFGLESRWLHYTMISGVAMAVASNVLLIILLNHPLSGPLRVTPDAYADVVADLTR